MPANPVQRLLVELELEGKKVKPAMHFDSALELQGECAAVASDILRTTRIYGVAIDKIVANADVSPLAFAEFLEDIGNTFLDYSEKITHDFQSDRSS